MQRIDILKKHEIKSSARIAVLRSLMDYPMDEYTEFRASVDVDLSGEWNIGLIVGNSGSGKTTIARELFGEFDTPVFDNNLPIFDCFSASPTKTAKMLSSVGLSSVPSWLRPWSLLSGGEQFRALVALALDKGAQNDSPVVIDEFTSVVDRDVAKIIANCVSKYARREKRKIVCVSCHFDIIDWLQPNWIIDMNRGEFSWRELRRRPEISLEIADVRPHQAWRLFERHHYMNGAQPFSVRAWCAFLSGRPIAYSSYAILPHPTVKNMMMGSRLVVLPDYQGLGIGRALTNFVADALHKSGYRVRNRTAHPGAQAIWGSDPKWRFVTSGRTSRGSVSSSIERKKTQVALAHRVTRCYEYSP